MSTYPWISISRENDVFELWSHKISLCDLGPGQAQAAVSLPLITFVGGTRKSIILSRMLGYSSTLQPHGQVHLASPKFTDNFNSEIYIDCELGAEIPSARPQSPACTSQSIVGSDSALNLGYSLVSNVFAPFSEVVCYFAADLRGIPGICSILAYQAVQAKAHSLPVRALPIALIVVETRASRFSHEKVQRKLYNMVLEEMNRLKKYANRDLSEVDLRSTYRDISVFGIRKDGLLSIHAQSLRQRIMSLSKEVHMGRTFTRYLFSLKHVETLVARSLERFCMRQPHFNFVRETRPKGFDCTDTYLHLAELLTVMPNHSWIWSVGVPLFASSIFLPNYLPDAHGTKAIAKIISDADQQARFIGCVKQGLREHFQKFEDDPNGNSAMNQHNEMLKSLWPHLSELKSFQSCLCCLSSRPEKVFECGHAICNVCIRRFSQRSTRSRHSFQLPNCILCGRFQSSEKTTFDLVPPSAGLRVLSIDGRGIRGVILLVHLNHMDEELRSLGSPVRNFFNYVCGTSAGGLVTIGVFLMQWSPKDCLSRFEDIASTTFKSGHDKTFSISRRFHSILRTFLRDHRYNLSPIERAFGAGFETARKMFNPLRVDTKVAVTATTVRENIPCIHSNYNGPRSDENNYQHVRAETFGHDISISDAAACTSAAPYYFKSKDVHHLDTYQDGGLTHNNPALLAAWECARIWPDKGRIFEIDKCRIDHLISLGTGSSRSNRYTVGPHSPKKDRFIHRIASWASGSMDSELLWYRFLSCVPESYRSRCLRLNLYFPGPEPALNDTDSIVRLKEQTKHAICLDWRVSQAKDSIITGVFYFELDGFSRLEGGAYQCSGNVFCRLPLDVEGRKTFYATLQTHLTSFTIRGRTVATVDNAPRGSPPFRLMLNFVVQSMEDEKDKLDISVKGLTSRPMLISGMPMSLGTLIRAQGFDAPFGCIDGHVNRPLPAVPSKRKLDQI
ncbi:FabD/lysophospholipase-like protein [Bimuria novae-zelandiae CBS 107.79]|uniref:FabD/lysophospholipase-like protein n=1 Tax=Bimuria novae-zelandiae CBS 107.79 TaxID=1447943 RepID=A0A6A5V801_9PLEO|nr:FabD/lysophospholipase-like protein [Bimuria novae-zelandiae CBS 107.79]